MDGEGGKETFQSVEEKRKKTLVMTTCNISEYVHSLFHFILRNQLKFISPF